MANFFTADGIKFFAKRLQNRQYRSGNTQDEVDGAKIKSEIFKPSNLWACQVAQILPGYQVREDNSWQNAGSFKEYAWTRLYLRELGDQSVYFRVGVDGRGEYITYNIDCYWDRLQSAEKVRLRAALDESGPEEQSIYPSEFPEYTWERLVTETVRFIQQHELFFRYLHTLLDANMEAEEKAKKEAAEAFAAKFPNPNIILYGPPGTGKTYYTLELAYELLTTKKPASYTEAQQLFQEEQGKRLEFVTFHQSFSYEDFVQGIKPEVNANDQLVFKPRNGVFYEIARRAREEYQRQHPRSDMPANVPFADVFNQLLEPLIEQQAPAVQISMKTPGASFPITDIGNGFITFRRGQEGQAINVQNAFLQSIYDGTTVLEKPTGTQIYYLYIVQRLRTLAQEMHTTIGPAHPQADLLLHSDRREIGEAAPAATLPTQAPRNYVLIIDEINRANISKVFGELITLLEKDKRLGGDNPLSVTLPSGETKFTVPANLYVIGTMNTADKSIALLDIALRRRFDFLPLYPKYTTDDNQPFKYAEVFRKLNENITRLKSRDFQIGHAYFMDRPGKPTESLAGILNKKVIPLLYEYFLNDAAKVVEAFKETGVALHIAPDTGLLRYNSAS